MTKSILAANLRLLRDYAKLSRQDMGAEVDVSGDSIYTYEERNTEPKPIVLEKFCEVFNISLKTLTSEKLTVKKLREIWNPNLRFAKDGSISSTESTVQDPEQEYATSKKKVEKDKTLVQASLEMRAMIRVLLRSQAELLATQRRQPVKKVLDELTRDVAAEISAEYDEL